MRELDSSQNGEINGINFLPKRQSSKKSFKCFIKGRIQTSPKMTTTRC